MKEYKGSTNSQFALIVKTIDLHARLNHLWCDLHLITVPTVISFLDSAMFRYTGIVIFTASSLDLVDDRFVVG